MSTRRLETMTTRRALAFALAWAVVVVFAVHRLDFPGSVPRFKAASGGGTLLDLSPASSADATYKRLADYGEKGRKSYFFRNMTVDVALPLSVLPFLLMLMLKAVKPMSLTRVRRGFLLVLPVAYVMFDMAENASVLALLHEYPARLDGLAQALPYVTSAKRVALLAALFVPLAMLGTRAVRRKVVRTAASESAPSP